MMQIDEPQQLNETTNETDSILILNLFLFIIFSLQLLADFRNRKYYIENSYIGTLRLINRLRI